MTEAYTFSSSPHSQPSPPPAGDEVKDANEDEQSRETEIFEDTLVLNSPFTETEVENLNPNTELVEDWEPVENMTTGPICEYEQEVVLDSEDEEMNNRDAVTVVKGFLEDETSPSMLLQKRRLKLPRQQANSNATTFGKSATGDKGTSIDAESFNDDNHLYLPGRLNHIHSPEPGDSTQAALRFVDQYLNNAEFFQEIPYRKTPRENSPHVFSAKGPLSLAKKIKARTQNEEKEPFKWLDSDQNDKEAGIYCKKNEASSNFGSYRQTYMRKRQKKGGHLQNQGNCSTGNRCDENSVQGPGMVTENNNPLKELDVQSNATRENVNVYSSVADTLDMSDIGLDTQIAAEAMDALAYRMKLI
ncbi:uncharacterized protein LOC133309719 [Gastrolobium bilobum]|uniref:uncharacterized protein LOC133309719 n=1 Tax=Gastrolobium bilobum TaxID=150636 RepID=UPI002AB180B0|nr:uncharacterized protein LOC133309719 [Gastrolobium bilobum]